MLSLAREFLQKEFKSYGIEVHHSHGHLSLAKSVPKAP